MRAVRLHSSLALRGGTAARGTWQLWQGAKQPYTAAGRARTPVWGGGMRTSSRAWYAPTMTVWQHFQQAARLNAPQTRSASMRPGALHRPQLCERRRL